MSKNQFQNYFFQFLERKKFKSLHSFVCAVILLLCAKIDDKNILIALWILSIKDKFATSLLFVLLEYSEINKIK